MTSGAPTGPARRAVLHAAALCAGLWCAPTVAWPSDRPTAADGAAAVAADRPSPIERFADAGGTLSLRLARSELADPFGYDVDHSDIERTALEGASAGLLRRTRLVGASRRRDELVLDRRDHDGLDLRSLSLGEQLQWRLLGTPGRGLGLAAGAALGLTRARTFTDTVWYPMLEINASLGLAVDPIRLELSVFRRATAEAELDGRDAAPGSDGVRLAIVLGGPPR